MTRNAHRSLLHLLVALALLLPGCAYSSSPTPASEPWVDECVATAFAWENEELAREADRALLSLNYPLFSPDYRLELYGADIWVEVDETFDARYGSRLGPGIEDVVFGRRTGEETWRVLGDPDAACPPLPEGTHWPTES